MEEKNLDHLYVYCERMGDPSLWGEPLNAVSNLFFIGFAIYAWYQTKPYRPLPFKKCGDIWVLIISMVAIGFGSALWHTYAIERWTVIADMVPIYIFINVYIFSLFMRLLGLNVFMAAMYWLIFTALTAVIQQTLPHDMLNGSLLYVPPFGLMLLVSVIMAVQKQPGAKMFAGVTALFFISLIFRTIDHMVCDTLPFGTHFVWHILNAVVLYRLVMVLLKYGRTTQTVSSAR